MTRTVLTPGGYDRLLRRIEEARAAYKAVCDDMPAALESGDTSGWHDNFAFEENQRQLHQLARRVKELEDLQAAVVVVRPLARPPDRVVVGASVTWTLDDDAPRTAWITGHGDGDPAAGRISYDSPLGQQLLGARPGDVRTVHVAGRQCELEILSIDTCPEVA